MATQYSQQWLLRIYTTDHLLWSFQRGHFLNVTDKEDRDEPWCAENEWCDAGHRRGTHPLIAARFTFRRLFMAGFAALTRDAVSFAVLMTIGIDAIRDLALIASIGVAILIFTNLIMLPMLLSYTGVSKAAAIRSLRNASQPTADYRRGVGSEPKS